MHRAWAMTAGIVSGLGVALGALGAHAVKGLLRDAPDAAARLDWWDTAARYHFGHGLALGLVAVLAARAPSRTARAAGLLFVAGTLLFSGSLYLLALTGVRAWAHVTPLGGFAFIGGWVLFTVGARQLPRA